jgi:ribosomal protein S18 acetylase RimI-like enzyme
VAGNPDVGLIEVRQTLRVLQPDRDDPALANVVWHALAGPHAAFREGTGGAVRYPSDVSVFWALPDEPTDADWRHLATMAGPGGAVTLFRESVTPPGGWDTAMHLVATQMVAVSVEGALDPDLVELGTADVPEMLALVEATQPGPFGPRTVELGGYVGVRDETGALVAMAGHRVRVAGFVEVSAVCTAESHRGRGLAARLVRHVVARADADGDTVILHAVASNVSAIRLYESLGFEHRRDIVAVSLTPPR